MCYEFNCICNINKLSNTIGYIGLGAPRITQVNSRKVYDKIKNLCKLLSQNTKNNYKDNTR